MDAASSKPDSEREPVVMAGDTGANLADKYAFLDGPKLWDADTVYIDMSCISSPDGIPDEDVLHAYVPVGNPVPGMVILKGGHCSIWRGIPPLDPSGLASTPEAIAALKAAGRDMTGGRAAM